MEYQVTIRPWGNSLGIRLPKNVLNKTNVRENDVLIVETEDDRIILKKVFKHKSFQERLKEFDGNISVCDFDWGEPEGRELM